MGAETVDRGETHRRPAATSVYVCAPESQVMPSTGPVACISSVIVSPEIVPRTVPVQGLPSGSRNAARSTVQAPARIGTPAKFTFPAPGVEPGSPGVVQTATQPP